MGPSLLEHLGRCVPDVARQKHEYNFMMFVEDLDMLRDIFIPDVDETTEYIEDLWPQDSFAEISGLELERQMVVRLSLNYKCTLNVDRDAYRPSQSFDIVLSRYNDDAYSDILRRFDSYNVKFQFMLWDYSVVLFIVSPIKYEHSTDDMCAYLSTNANNVFQMECLETFVCLDDLINRVSTSRLPVYSSECCAYHTRFFTVENSVSGELCLRELPDIRPNVRLPRNLNFTDCFYFALRVKGFQFDVLTERPSCRGLVVVKKYFYKWLRFAWRSGARGRCARRIRRCAMHWREYLYYPRFGLSRVQNEWKDRFQSNAKRMRLQS